MGEETWLPVVGFEGLYSVSDAGRVRSEERRVMMRGDMTRLVRESIVSSRITPNGYVGVLLHDRGDRTHRTVHSLVLEAFVGPRPDRMVACHADGNKQNNSLDNLRWDTQSANVRDCVEAGSHHNASKTHCKNGHALSGDNLYVRKRKGGGRSCRACGRESARKRAGANDHA